MPYNGAQGSKKRRTVSYKRLQLFDLTVLTDYLVKTSSDRENLCSQSHSKRPKRSVFFHIVWERNMQLHPRHFGRNLRENFVSKLMKDVEGTCSARHGFVVAITGIENIGKGWIRDGTGFVTFPVKYQCVVFRPFKGEILEAVVTMMGFFAEAGPVQIFVSNHLIPDDMEFKSGDMPNYTTSDGSVKIQKDSEVRLKIIGTRVDAKEIFCIGTIKDDFLGSKHEDSDSSSNKAKSHKKSDKSGKKEGNVDDADYQGATTTTTTAISDAGMAAAAAVGATTAHASAVE
ncbi:hypothetical protein J1N35_031888 [Gossypium stocksii]|uniref:DNA-directed RNA polymerase subunit n=1 Tax=Gossypium stocksii TaxID=47602 RepID=A0A9D3V2C0_9ROSI|nr:hypothetical protein J1N35_031888 [Gossypium stocksii]